MATSIHSGCIPVLRSFGFSEEDIASIRKRRSLNLPSPGKLAKRIIAIRKGLSLAPRNGKLVKTVTMWPEILQYRCTRIFIRIEHLMVWTTCNRGQAVDMLRRHPAILGIAPIRIIHIAEIIRHIGANPAKYPRAFLISPKVIRGRLLILHARGEFDIRAGMLFYTRHVQFQKLTRRNFYSVCSEDQGQSQFLATRFNPPLRIVP